jgi:hypothetical protein
MTATDWAGIGVAICGAVLLLNIAGFTRGAAELLSELKRRGGTMFVTGPTTVWGLRVLGAGLIVLGACIVVSADPT